MKTLSNMIKMLSISGLLILAGLALGAPRASAAVAVNPEAQAITSQVQHKLASLPWYGVFDHLQYQVNGTEVILSGQIISEHAVLKGDAAGAVRHIPGVTKIVNNIEVLPPSAFDDQIRRAEYRSIFSMGGLGRYTMGPVPQVHIIVKNGHVVLEGLVMNKMDQSMAGVAANTVSNVFSVQNNLRIG